MFLDTVNRPPRRIGTTVEDKEPSKPPGLPLTRDSLVGFRWFGVSFRWYCGVGGLVVGH